MGEKAAADALGQLESELLQRNKRLAEDTSVSGKSQLGAHRVRTDHFKGFSADYKQTFYAENARQMQEKQEALAAEKALEAGYAEHVKRTNEAARQTGIKRHIEKTK